MGELTLMQWFIIVMTAACVLGLIQFLIQWGLVIYIFKPRHRLYSRQCRHCEQWQVVHKTVTSNDMRWRTAGIINKPDCICHWMIGP